ncbi:unnamed protein product [Prorocentrum cordatum]|uniref:Uncharacterized protein n=1 Tax=Prorocentrum cordatum TaxID=2364126 RepID=A0ABN9RQ32_9DINO|nr:unnamed protein product [Polarella glacialis]
MQGTPHKPRCECGCVPSVPSLFEMAELRKEARRLRREQAAMVSPPPVPEGASGALSAAPPPQLLEEAALAGPRGVGAPPAPAGAPGEPSAAPPPQPPEEAAPAGPRAGRKSERTPAVGRPTMGESFDRDFTPGGGLALAGAVQDPREDHHRRHESPRAASDPSQEQRASGTELRVKQVMMELGLRGSVGGSQIAVAGVGRGDRSGTHHAPETT